MGSSLLKYRDMGIWAQDSTTQVWLHMLLQEIDAEPDLPDWAQNLRKDWFHQATDASVGGITIGLDQYANSTDRVSWLIRLSEQALLRLASYGDIISKDVLNALPHAVGVYWTNGCETDVFMQLGRKFVELLRGELTIDPADPRWIVHIKQHS